MKKNNFVNYLLKLLSLSALFMITITSKINASVKIGRPVKIVSLCFENKNFEDIIQIIDDEGKKEVDIIVLPETWRGQISPETLDGETISTLSKLAKKHNTYILSPIDRKEGKSRLNTAVLIDRKGEIVFTYDKIYPYWSEFDLDPPVDPGTNTNSRIMASIKRSRCGNSLLVQCLFSRNTVKGILFIASLLYCYQYVFKRLPSVRYYR